MAFGNGAPRGWPTAGIVPGDLPAYQPQWIGAGAWEPLSTNTEQATTPIERTAGHDAVWTTLKFDFETSDQWHFQTIPPVTWTSGKIAFIPHFIIIDDIATPGTIIFELGAEFMADEFNIDAMAFQTITSTDTPSGDIDPAYFIGPQSSDLTLTGSPAATGSINLRLKRNTDTESDPVYFVGLKLLFI